MLTPASYTLCPDGTPYSTEFEDVYHAAHGGLEQSRLVFLAGNGLPERWRGRERFVVLETGFGLGLNFLCTWDAWRRDPERSERLHFISVEKYPFTAADMQTLHGRLPGLAELSKELCARWPLAVPGFHRLHFDGGRVTLTLIFGDATECLSQVEARVDAFYLDGFSPAKNPELWSPPLFKSISRLAAPGATAATYTVAAVVRQGLSDAGFVPKKCPGFPPKRDRLEARFQPRFPVHPLPAPLTDRRAIVIGAGIAGTSVAERLAERGWAVEVLERRDQPGREASGNHAGCLLPMVSPDDNKASRISRACFLHTLRLLRALRNEGSPARWGTNGLLQLAKNDAQARATAATAAKLAFPDAFLRFVDAIEASRLLDHPVDVGGLYFPDGAWANPPGVCRALLERHPQNVTARFHVAVDRIEQRDGLWHALDQAGNSLASAPVLVIASGAEAARFAQAVHAPLRGIRGQVSHLPASRFQAPPISVCRDGYLTPDVDGTACVGATFDVGDRDEQLRIEDHAENLAHLERLMPGTSAGLDPATLQGKVGFRPASPDRLPMVGALATGETLDGKPATQLKHLARHAGLYAALGYGSRGLAWAALMAEMLVCRIEGDPMPLEKDLLEALDPGRFLLRAARKGTAIIWSDED